MILEYLWFPSILPGIWYCYHCFSFWLRRKDQTEVSCPLDFVRMEFKAKLWPCFQTSAVLKVIHTTQICITSSYIENHKSASLEGPWVTWVSALGRFSFPYVIPNRCLGKADLKASCDKSSTAWPGNLFLHLIAVSIRVLPGAQPQSPSQPFNVSISSPIPTGHNPLSLCSCLIQDRPLSWLLSVSFSLD